MNPDREVTLEAILLDAPVPGDRPPSLESPRPALVICPGGGYEYLSQREADPVVAAFMRYGFNAFILRYSVREHAFYPNPAVDAARAVRWVRKHAAELDVDPTRVAVMGFSAGGHVAALLGTRWNDEGLVAAERAEYEALSRRGVVANDGLMDHPSRPDAIVPCYAVFSFDWAPPEGRLTNLLKTDCITAVSSATPPAFVWTTGADETVPPSQSLRFVTALASAGVEFEYHHFARGPHGLATADAVSNADRPGLPENAHAWVDLCAKWLRATFDGR